MKNRGKWTIPKPRDINGKTYYSCIKRIGVTTTYNKSAYKYECDLCVHSIDTMGKSINEYDGSEFIPRAIYCPFEECPYKSDFENRELAKRQLIEAAKAGDEAALKRLKKIAEGSRLI